MEDSREQFQPTQLNSFTVPILRTDFSIHMLLQL